MRIVSLVAILALVACGADKASAMPPGRIKPKITVVVDSMNPTLAVDCPAVARNTSCTFTQVRDVVSGTEFTTSGNRTVAVGASFSTALHCSAPGAQIRIEVFVIGNAPGVPPSPPNSSPVVGTYSCPNAAAVTPTVTIRITP